MQKNKKSYLLALLVLLSNFSYAQTNVSTQFDYLNIKNSNIKSIGQFGFNEISKYLANKEREKKIYTLSQYISYNYNVELENAEKIVKTSFAESEKHNIEPTLILSIIGVESTFKQDAISDQGAIGLAQVMPQFHKEKVSKIKKQNLDLFSIKGNIMVSVQIVKEYLTLSNGNLQVALQRYNGSLFDKNKSYSKKVLAKMKTFNAVVSA